MSEAGSAALNRPPRSREAAALDVARTALLLIRRGTLRPREIAVAALADIATLLGEPGDG